MNTAIMIGHLTADATTRTVKVKNIDTLVTDFTLAVNEGFGDNQRTEYVRCTVWRDRGAKLAPHMKKGRAVVVKGSISANAWIGTKGENAGKAQAQLTMTNPAIELYGKSTGNEPDDVPFLPDEELA